MRKVIRLLPAVVCVVALLSQATAQPPAGKATQEPGKEKAKDFSNSSIVTRMMAFDKNKDGKLTKDEVTDIRLHRLFDQADANKDGVVTKEELMALAAQREAEIGQGGGRGPGGPGGFGGPGGRGPGGPGGRGPGGPGGPGGARGRGPGGPDAPGGARGRDPAGPGGREPGGPGAPGGRGPGGPGGFGGPPQPGQVLPPFLQARLNLTAQQKTQLDELQKEVDSKLGKILTDEQKNQLKEMRQGFGPGGPGGRGPDGVPPGG
jgi:hypothetical protein